MEDNIKYTWDAVEIKGYDYYASRGYRVLVSLVKNSGFDFVAEKDNKYIKVNVKVAGRKNKRSPNSWSISKASGGLNAGVDRINYDVDIYLVWLPHKEFFIELPSDFLHITNSKSRCIPKHFIEHAL
jgi:hypothetical protein